MKGNGTTQIVKAIRKIRAPGLGITTCTVEASAPWAFRLSGSNLLLDADDVVVLKHVTPAVGATLLLMVSIDGQTYYALGVI